MLEPRGRQSRGLRSTDTRKSEGQRGLLGERQHPTPRKTRRMTMQFVKIGTKTGCLAAATACVLLMSSSAMGQGAVRGAASPARSAPSAERSPETRARAPRLEPPVVPWPGRPGSRTPPWVAPPGVPRWVRPPGRRQATPARAPPLARPQAPWVARFVADAAPASAPRGGHSPREECFLAATGCGKPSSSKIGSPQMSPVRTRAAARPGRAGLALVVDSSMIRR